MSLTFREFRQKNLERCEADTGFKHELESWSVAQWVMAFVGELGEACNARKKLLRLEQGVTGNKPSETKEYLEKKLCMELHDAYTYFDLLVARCGLDPETYLIDGWNAKSEEIGYDGPRLRHGIKVAAKDKDNNVYDMGTVDVATILDLNHNVYDMGTVASMPQWHSPPHTMYVSLNQGHPIPILMKSYRKQYGKTPAIRWRCPNDDGFDRICIQPMNYDPLVNCVGKPIPNSTRPAPAACRPKHGGYPDMVIVDDPLQETPVTNEVNVTWPNRPPAHYTPDKIKPLSTKPLTAPEWIEKIQAVLNIARPSQQVEALERLGKEQGLET